MDSCLGWGRSGLGSAFPQSPDQTSFVILIGTGWIEWTVCSSMRVGIWIGLEGIDCGVTGTDGRNGMNMEYGSSLSHSTGL